MRGAKEYLNYRYVNIMILSILVKLRNFFKYNMALTFYLNIFS
jgi:hypothetical protein